MIRWVLLFLSIPLIFYGSVLILSKPQAWKIINSFRWARSRYPDGRSDEWEREMNMLGALLFIPGFLFLFTAPFGIGLIPSLIITLAYIWAWRLRRTTQ